MFERSAACKVRYAGAPYSTAKGRSLPVILLMLATVGVQAGGDQGSWYYVVGIQRNAQQANFCLQEKLALELARTFEQQGARSGYAALDRAAGCTIRVQSFTPLRVIKRVPVATRGGGQYTVKVVEVQTASGTHEYLITTREVRD